MLFGRSRVAPGTPPCHEGLPRWFPRSRAEHVERQLLVDLAIQRDDRSGGVNSGSVIVTSAAVRQRSHFSVPVALRTRSISATRRLAAAPRAPRPGVTSETTSSTFSGIFLLCLDARSCEQASPLRTRSRPTTSAATRRGAPAVAGRAHPQQLPSRSCAGTQPTVVSPDWWSRAGRRRPISTARAPRHEPRWPVPARFTTTGRNGTPNPYELDRGSALGGGVRVGRSGRKHGRQTGAS
jgi:hypothetical protein